MICTATVRTHSLKGKQVYFPFHRGASSVFLEGGSGDASAALTYTTAGASQSTQLHSSHFPSMPHLRQLASLYSTCCFWSNSDMLQRQQNVAEKRPVMKENETLLMSYYVNQQHRLHGRRSRLRSTWCHSRPMRPTSSAGGIETYQTHRWWLHAFSSHPPCLPSMALLQPSNWVDGCNQDRSLSF